MKACPKCGTEYPDTTTLCPSDGIALEKTGDSLIGKTLAGKYRIDERLSEGGMGTVYRGTHVLMDKTVAVKVLRPSLAADEKIVARFSREARAASRINHPHALSVTDFGENEDGVVFLIMEYLSGQTLKQVIRNEGPMALSRVVEIIKQVGGALDDAHSQGVVHRDLKSDNIMLITATSADYAKVLDFGIAKIKEADGDYDPGLTSPDLVIGTPQYMSPEQCSQAPDIDARSDIYSLGIIIFEMLVGHVPFTGESPTVIMLKQMQHPPPSLTDERSDVPTAVATVVKKALEKRPEHRYETVGELVEDLSIAAGMDQAAVATNGVQANGAAPLVPEDGDDDEETLVRRRYTRPMQPALAPPPVAEVYEEPTPPPPPASGFNPWKILIPSAVGLLLIFGVIFAFTRNSQQPTELTPGSGLAADPNSQPVEAASAPTGAAEVGIPTAGAANQNAEPAASPSPTASPEEVGKESDNQNANTSKSPPIPTPTQVIVEAPLPTPSATKPPAPKPTLPPPSASPPGIEP